MSEPDVKVSDAELQVLQLLWEESPLDAVEVSKRLPAERGWSLPTVKTLLSRLVAKGAAAAEAQGRRYLYRPSVEREAIAAVQADRLVDRLFGGRVSPLVAHLAERQRLSEEDIAEIEKILRELKS